LYIYLKEEEGIWREKNDFAPRYFGVIWKDTKVIFAAAIKKLIFFAMWVMKHFS